MKNLSYAETYARLTPLQQREVDLRTCILSSCSEQDGRIDAVWTRPDHPDITVVARGLNARGDYSYELLFLSDGKIWDTASFVLTYQRLEVGIL